MLTLKSITLENFGPFKGSQTISFPAEPGVVIVYGENMRGKTTLLNAIRYAFYGYVTGRGERQIDLHKVGNWEAAAEGQYGFKVILRFDFKSTEYELTRHCQVRQGVTTPTSANDFVHDTHLRRGTEVLGPGVRDRALAQMLPESVSRFFLFDGELLQQYEELLREDSAMGVKIKEAIERILGVPVLTNARADLRELHKQAQAQEGKAAQKDQRTRELGNHHQALVGQRAHHESELQRLKGDREALGGQRKSLEDALKKSERVKALLFERDTLNTAITEIERKLEEKRAQIREQMSQAWRWVLSPALQAVATDVDGRIEQLRAREARRAVIAETTAALDKALDSGACNSCSRPLDDPTRAVLTERVSMLRSELYGSGGNAGLLPLIQRQAALKHFIAADKTDLVAEMKRTIDDLRVDRATRLDRVAEIQEQTRNLDESEIRRISSEYDKVGQEIAVLDTGIRQEAAKVQEHDEQIRRVEEQLKKMGGADLTKERARREMTEALLKLFDKAVDEYRDRLRTKVQDDATALFRQLTTEADYDRLSINEHYGLTIVHKDGESIPVRSAGAEHIVALSLMGALQRNAPLRGPIIMDSPFGRLDEGHTTHVVHTLPSMADQVLLLAYESELDPKLARKELMAKLRREYRLVRKTARHSTIEPIME